MAEAPAPAGLPDPLEPPEPLDVVVVGAGQAGLAVGYFLHRHDRDTDRHGLRPLSYALLDAHDRPGGAWPDGWHSLRLFSPAGHSSLPGRPMPGGEGSGNPPATHVTDYLTAYEARYDLPVRRPVVVREVHEDPGGTGLLLLDTDQGPLRTRHLVNATGTWDRPFVPTVPGAKDFTGTQHHVVDYTDPSAYAGRTVLVVGGGNSGAQVCADMMLAHAAGEPAPDHVHWVTRREPRYLPDDVDGRVLFETATQAVKDRAAGRESQGVGSLGDVVATPDVRRARDDLGMRAHVGLVGLGADAAHLADGTSLAVDTVVWATGFRPALRHLRGLGLSSRDGHPATVPGTTGASPTRSVDDERVWFVGYGDWCGPASATLIGVGRAARDTVGGVVSSLT